MTIEPSQNVYYTANSIRTYDLGPTTFTFKAPNSIAITNVVFMNGFSSVSATYSGNETEYKVTLDRSTTFSGFNVTYGYISGSCGSNATWSLGKQNGQYTKLTISGSGATDTYSTTTVGGIARTTAPWGYDLTSVTIGSSITSIGNNAFSGCTGLQHLNIQRTDGLVTLGSNGLSGCDALQYIVAPTPALAVQYKTASNWNTYEGKMSAEFGDYVFYATNEGGTPAYAITNESDLRHLASAINNGNEGIANGKTFRQTKTITLSSTNFDRIGYNDYHYFTGTYDGGSDYTISDLNVGNVSGGKYFGLFGYVKNGTVKNVRLVNSTVSATGLGACLGSLIGKTYNAAVRNCVVFDPHYVTSGAHNGAIIGSNSSSTLENLYFYDGDLNNAIGNGGSGTNVGRVRKVILGSGIGSVTPAINPTSTILDNGFVYDNKTYYREGLELTLASNLSATGNHVVYKADNNTLTGNTYTVSGTDVTLTALLEYNTYTVRFYGNGSTSGSMSNQAFTYGTAQQLTANGFTRAFTVTYNYEGATGGNSHASATATATFNGWATTASGEKVYNNQQSVINLTPTNGGTVDLFAKWTDASVTLPTPTKTGYTFAGWYSDSGLNTHVGAGGASYTPSANITLYAKWTPITYTVAFNGNGNTSGSMSNQTFTYDVAQALTANAYTRAFTVTYHYNEATGGNTPASATATATFNGWAESAGGTVAYTNKKSVSNLANTNGATKTLYANWTDASVTLPTPSRTGYTFGGWYSDSGLNTSVGAAGASYTPSTNVDLYAKWTPINYTVAFNGNGHTDGEMSPQQFTYDVEQALTANAYSRAFIVTYNYEGATGGNSQTSATATATFNGWTYGAVTYSDHQSVINLTTTNGATVTLNAKWTDASVTLPTPTKTGYTFGGWYSDAGLTASVGGAGASYTPTEDIPLYAKWDIITYTITYYLDGGSVATPNPTSYDIETETITLPTPTRTGYTFDGWYTNEGLTSSAVTTIDHGSTENKEFWAKWTANTYTVHFDGNGSTSGEMGDQSFIYGESSYLTANAFTRKGYTFAGWATTTDGDVAYADQESVSNLTDTDGGTVTLYAKWGIPYIDANGNTQTCSNYTVLTDDTNIDNLDAGWYVVTENVRYSSTVWGSGDIHLILCDGAIMTVEAIYMGMGDGLTIYAQSTGSSMGQLEATSQDRDRIIASSITICGGKITATGSYSNQFCGIRAMPGNITIHSGQVNAYGYSGIQADGNITLGWRNAGDYIYASSYVAYGGTLAIASGKDFIDEDGTIHTAANVGTIDGKTLKPSTTQDIAMNNFGIMTYASPYDLNFTGIDGLTAYVASEISGNTLTLSAVKKVPGGTGLLLRGTAGSNFTVPTASATAISSNLLVGLTEATLVSQTTDDGIAFILANGSEGINWYKLEETSYTLKANSAYLRLPSSMAPSASRALTMVFEDEAAAMHSAQCTMHNEADAWYDLSGRKIVNGKLSNGKLPKGVYIHNGRKEVMK